MYSSVCGALKSIDPLLRVFRVRDVLTTTNNEDEKKKNTI